MRYLYIFLLFFAILPETIFGQIGGPNSTTEVKGGMRIDSAFALPWYTPFASKGSATTGRAMISKTDSLPQYMKAGVVKKVLSKWDSATVYVDAGEVGQPYGVAGLNSSGVVPSANLPAIVVNGQVYVDTNQAEMLSHSAATAGALSIRTDSSNNLYCLVTTPYNVRANWHITQGNGVSAFNGRTGAITPRSLDYKTDSVPEGLVNQYFTPTRVQAVNATDTGSGGWLASQAQVKDSAAAVRAAVSMATVAIGSTVTGLNNKNILFGKGNTLWQNNLFYIDTTSGSNSLVVGNPASNFSQITPQLFSNSSSNGFIQISAGTGSGLIRFSNTSTGGQIFIYPPSLSALGASNQYLRPVNDSFAYLGDIAARAATWVHLTTVTHSSFTAAAVAQTINSSYTLPAGWVVTGIVMNPSTTFSGGSIATYTISVGGTVSGNTSAFAPATNVFTGAPTYSKSIASVESFSSGSIVTLSASSTGGNLNTATQGSVDIYLLVSQL